MTLEIDHFPGRALETAQGEYIYFGGTAYLGLQTHTSFVGRFQKNLEVYGTAYAASRHSNVQLNPYREGEAWLAGITGAPGALYVSAGFTACQLVRKHFGKKKYPLFFAPHTHSALLFPDDQVHDSLDALKNDIAEALDKDAQCTPVVFFDTVDFAGTKPLQFEWLQTLPLERIILVADDSHAIGITGERGGGSYRRLLELNPFQLMVCGSLGKGFGIGGGFLLGGEEDLSAISQDPWFGGSSPGTPAGLQTLMQSEDLLEDRRYRLKANTALFVQQCTYRDRFAWSEGYPCFSITDEHLAAYLKERAMVITNFRYPNADSPLMCRIVISAFHHENDILQLTKTLNTYFENLNNS